MNICQPEVAAGVTIRELLVIQAQQVQHGCMQIGNVNAAAKVTALAARNAMRF